MSITIDTMPIICLLWIVVGVVFIIISVIRLANHQESDNHYVTLKKEQGQQTNDLEELFSYFLEEEEKKNQGFRDLLVNILRKQTDLEADHLQQSTKEHQKRQMTNEKLYDEIVKHYENGESIEMIAKNLKKGVGEVKLILSLYNMR